jgi:hypothetical protein
MKQGQFTNEQIVTILQEAEKGEKSVAALCKEKGITPHFVWVPECHLLHLAKEIRRHPSQRGAAAPRPGKRELPIEAITGRTGFRDRLPQGSRLKKLVTAPQKRAAVGHLVTGRKCSERQACRFVGLSRSTARYRVRSKAEEAILVERLKEFAQKRHRQRRGYRLAYQELRRAGGAFAGVNHKRGYPLCG